MGASGAQSETNGEEMTSTTDTRALEGRVAFITGAARGMGRAHAFELADRGARVAVVDLDGREAEEVARDVRARGGEALAFGVDVTDRAAVESAVAKTAAAWGRFDILVSNAGIINDFSTLADTDDAEFHRQIAINVDGLLHASRAALPWLERSPAGRIIVVSSFWAQMVVGHSYGYVAAKAATMAMARNLAVELTPKGILVNAIAPGSVATRMIPDPAKELELYPIPVGRMAEPEEISKLVAFLAGDDAGFISGQVISPNGGAHV